MRRTEAAQQLVALLITRELPSASFQFVKRSWEVPGEIISLLEAPALRSSSDHIALQAWQNSWAEASLFSTGLCRALLVVALVPNLHRRSGTMQRNGLSVLVVMRLPHLNLSLIDLCMLSQ